MKLTSKEEFEVLTKKRVENIEKKVSLLQEKNKKKLSG